MVICLLLANRAILEQGPKANSFGIEVIGRTYYVIAESPEDCRSWVNSLHRVQSATPQEMKEMKEDSLDPRNAVVRWTVCCFV